jgi:hypothetical protein
MAADKELDGLAQTRFGGFFNARRKVATIPAALAANNRLEQISSSNGISSARAAHSTDSNPSPGQGWPNR